jgi:hypothetical protein
MKKLIIDYITAGVFYNVSVVTAFLIGLFIGMAL